MVLVEPLSLHNLIAGVWDGLLIPRSPDPVNWLEAEPLYSITDKGVNYLTP